MTMRNDKFNDSLGDLLDSGRLNMVIDTLRNNCLKGIQSHPDLSMVIDEVDSVSDTYSRLRSFLIDGKPDDRRDALIEDLKRRLRQAGRTYLFIINENRPDPFFAEYRLQKIRPVSLEYIADDLRKIDYRIEMAEETEANSLSFRTRREETINLLFGKVWSLAPWEAEDLKALESLASDYMAPSKLGADASFEVKAQIVSALLLSLLKFNDPAKFLLLINIYNFETDERLAARALTSITLVIGRWGHSLLVEPKVRLALEALESDILTYSRLKEVVMSLIRTRDTDRVSREISEAFQATMKEISPDMIERLQKEGLTIDAAETGMNPEWEKLMRNKELEERMMKINDMQIEGMDVMMQTFARLKSFPFFRSVSNWFLPFSTSHTALQGLFDNFNGEGFQAMTDATEMCASDRFSFSLGLLQMPEEKRRMLSLTLGAQLEALKDMSADKVNVNRKSVFASEVLLFARDLYRFAKLFPRHDAFYDPFEHPIDFLRLPLLGSLLAGDEIITKAADFYFKHGYYSLALSLYKIAEGAGDSDRQLYEKIGFCHQMESDLLLALENYEKADLFSSDSDRSSSWLIKKLAFCNKALGNYLKAAEYYSRLLDYTPDDQNLEFHLGSVLIKAGDIKRGKELISKVHYLNPGHQMAERIFTRLKGHDAFLEGRFSDAISLYDKARGNQSAADYRKELEIELSSISPEADIPTLRILLDSDI